METLEHLRNVKVCSIITNKQQFPKSSGLLSGTRFSELNKQATDTSNKTNPEFIVSLLCRCVQ